jgi:mRNA interferase MazF
VRHPGQIVLFRFPQTDLLSGKLRPALLLGKLPGPYDDWLMCMVSSQESQYLPDFDEIIREDDPDFARSGLRVSSVIRCGRLAVVEGAMLVGATGDIGSERLQRIKARLASWLVRT